MDTEAELIHHHISMYNFAPIIQRERYYLILILDNIIYYWLRSQFPIHAKDFIDDFQSLQVKLLASYHGLHDESDLMRAWSQFREVYERAALPINKGGMGLRTVIVDDILCQKCESLNSKDPHYLRNNTNLLLLY